MRLPLAETRRLSQISELAAKRMHLEGFTGQETLFNALEWSRKQTQRISYRVREAHGPNGDVSLDNIVARQTKILGLPNSAKKTLLDAELDVEAQSVKPNFPLLDWLAHVRREGKTVIAISDIPYSGIFLEQLFNLVGVTHLPIDTIYTSADEAATKRGGDLFEAALRKSGLDPETTIHIGDDWLADVRRAAESGLRSLHLPRAASFTIRRKLNGFRFVSTRNISDAFRPKAHFAFGSEDQSDAQYKFGFDILGPLMLEVTALTWIAIHELNEQDNAKALYCARGGLVMHEIFDRVTRALDWPVRIPIDDIMVSRLVAARLALPKKDPVITDILAQHFKSSTVAEFADTIAQKALDVDQVWRRPVTTDALTAFLNSDDAANLFDSIEYQNQLFSKHLDKVIGDAQRVILVDTGLVGNTLAFLETAQPRRNWELIQIARSNYSGQPSNHFRRTLGLLTELDRYSPFYIRSSVLRYWHLFEYLLEPDLRSVKRFIDDGDRVKADLQVKNWRSRVETPSNRMIQGVFGFIEQLTPSSAASEFGRLDEVWRRFKSLAVYPGRVDFENMAIGERGMDFGTNNTATARSGRAETTRKAEQLRQSTWRAGTAVGLYPNSYRIRQLLMESKYCGARLFELLRGRF